MISGQYLVITMSMTLHNYMLYYEQNLCILFHRHIEIVLLKKIKSYPKTIYLSGWEKNEFLFHVEPDGKVRLILKSGISGKRSCFSDSGICLKE